MNNTPEHLLTIFKNIYFILSSHKNIAGSWNGVNTKMKWKDMICSTKSQTIATLRMIRVRTRTWIHGDESEHCLQTRQFVVVNTTTNKKKKQIHSAHTRDTTNSIIVWLKMIYNWKWFSVSAFCVLFNFHGLSNIRIGPVISITMLRLSSGADGCGIREFSVENNHSSMT